MNESGTSSPDCKYKHMLENGAPPEKLGPYRVYRLLPTAHGFAHIVQGQMYHIPKNLASNVNLSYCMNLWALGGKLQKNYCWTFFP